MTDEFSDCSYEDDFAGSCDDSDSFYGFDSGYSLSPEKVRDKALSRLVKRRAYNLECWQVTLEKRKIEMARRDRNRTRDSILTCVFFCIAPMAMVSYVIFF